MRLSIYEEAYGLTVERILVQAFIIWLGMVFLWLGYKIIKDVEDRPFVFGIFISAIAFFVLFNLFNPDAFVARKNIQQFAQIGKLDTDYLTANLSADAVSELIPLLTMPGIVGKNGKQVAHEIAVRLKEYRDAEQNQPWQSFHFSRKRALLLIERNWEPITKLSQD